VSGSTSAGVISRPTFRSQNRKVVDERSRPERGEVPDERGVFERGGEGLFDGVTE